MQQNGNAKENMLQLVCLLTKDMVHNLAEGGGYCSGQLLTYLLDLAELHRVCEDSFLLQFTIFCVVPVSSNNIPFQRACKSKPLDKSIKVSSEAINPKEKTTFPQDTGVHSHTISTNGPGTSSNEMVQPYPTKHSLSIPPPHFIPHFEKDFDFTKCRPLFGKRCPNVNRGLRNVFTLEWGLQRFLQRTL
ncbi:hypothetical protein CEXT_815791 [Caerostris extrusa]|uniref:Uncharacterized protein n=1 Tax=Caerostris extrusa TaxID=172846 RepID=A0AAV4YAV5_CAEEX|nr:hypothetical protein CEXT_815791 [Caerostris extrusa]